MKILFVYFILLSVLFPFVGCGQKGKLENIDLEHTIELNQTKTSPDVVLNACIGSMITPEEGYNYYKRLLDYIGQRLDSKVNFIDKETYAEVNSLLKNGSIDMAFVCGGPYIEAHDEFGLELLVAPQVDGKTVYYSYIIVANRSGIERLEELRGKKFAFVDPLSNTGKLIPTYILQKELGENPDDFFKECLYTYDHDKSIKAVAHGIIDGAAVDSIVWEYMYKKGYKYVKDTKVIKISQPYGIPPIVVRPGLNQALKIKDILLNMHKEKEGLDILKGMFIDKFVEVDDSNYDGIRKVKIELEKNNHALLPR